jgi:hypothetical protein
MRAIAGALIALKGEARANRNAGGASRLGAQIPVIWSHYE